MQFMLPSMALHGLSVGVSKLRWGPIIDNVAEFLLIP